MFDCDPVSVVDGVMAAVNARDLDAVVAFWAPDISVEGVPEDRDALKRTLSRAFDEEPGVEVSHGDRVANSQYVIQWEIAATAAGEELHRNLVEYEVTNCLVRRVKVLEEVPVF